MCSLRRIALALVLGVASCQDITQPKVEPPVITASVTPAGASTVTIDFETDGSGNPLVGFALIAASEYAAQGLLSIVDSDPAVGFTNVNPTNPLNVETAISGEHVNVGAFAATPNTFIELTFAPGSEALSVSFDWATGARAEFVRVSLFGIGNVPLGVVDSPATDAFINLAGFTVPAGSFSVDGLGLIERVVIEDQPGAIRGLALDNLHWTVGRAIDIDIKPGSDPNSINCNNKKKLVAVAILTTGDFDATTVDHTTVTFEGATETHVDKRTGRPRRHEEDVDGDGDTDLLLHFRLGDTGLTCGSTEGTLSGETFDGTLFEGTDAVRMTDAGPPATIQMSVSAGSRHSCEVTTAGAAYCWGQNGNGQLGDGTNTSSNVPVEVLGGLTFQSVSAGALHTCGLTTDGPAYCWGWNGNGTLGDGTNTDSNVPVGVDPPF